MMSPFTASGGLLSLAKEALKPTSSAIDALVAPKILRLAEWARERDLWDRLEGDRLERLFDGYLRQTYRRASGVLSLVFPQQVLPLPAIYEPLCLVDMHERSVSEDDIRVDGARSLIIDSAGMGKTTFVKHLILSELESRESIPIFLELRRIAEDQNLIDAIGAQFDTLDVQFDRDVLLRLFRVGKFLIVLDGFDEIPQPRRAALGKQIEELALRAEFSAVVLTARPQVELPTMAGAKALTIEPLRPEQAESLVLRLDSLASIDVGRRLVKEFTGVPRRFLVTPLLVSLLYRTYGFNGTVSSRITTFYNEVYDAFYKGHDLTKAGFSRPKASGLDIDQFRRLLRGFAFLMICNQLGSIPNEAQALQLIADASRLTAVSPTSPPDFFSDLLLSVPLMVRDGGDFHFIHKTVGEYFAAEYLVMAEGGDGLLSEIRNSPLLSAFAQVLEFFAEMSPQAFRRSIVAPLAALASMHKPGWGLARRTLSFLFDVRIGVWPDRKYHEVAPKPFPVSEPRSSEYYLYTLMQGVKMRVVIAQRRKHVILPVVWEKLTFESVAPSTSTDSELPFSLPTGLPLQRWFSLEEFDSASSAILNLLESICASAIAFSQTLGDLALGTRIRVIDQEAIDALLSTVRFEDEHRKSLLRLLRPGADDGESLVIGDNLQQGELRLPPAEFTTLDIRKWMGS
jgi:hypothetical protein